MTEYVSAHSPSKIYLTYDAGKETLTVYIDHSSSEPDTHYIENVTVSVNDVEYLNKTYTTQELDGGKGMGIYSYTVTASEGDVIFVTAESRIDGKMTEKLTVKADDGKDDEVDAGAREQKRNRKKNRAN